MKPHPIIILIVACLAVSFYRVFTFWEMTYLFLVWNLFLAWIPYKISTMMNKDHSPIIKISLLAIVLLFLPNAAYLLTDMIHYRKSSLIQPWYDMVLFTTYAFTGLVITYFIVESLQKHINTWVNKKFHVLVAPLLFVIVGTGIYVGRIERYNSWDAIIHPFRFISHMFSIVTSAEVIGLMQFSLLFASFTGLFYYFIKYLIEHQKSNHV